MVELKSLGNPQRQPCVARRQFYESIDCAWRMGFEPLLSGGSKFVFHNPQSQLPHYSRSFPR